MLYMHRRPRPPLDAYVESIWLCQNPAGPRRLERVLPSGSAQLIVNLAEDQTRLYQGSNLTPQVLPGTILSGIATRYQIIDSDEQAHVAGVVFNPGGTSAFTRLPASELTNADVPVADLWNGSNRLREQLLAAASPGEALSQLENWLFEMWLQRTGHPAVRFALEAFHSSPAIARIRDVTDMISLSPKRFIQKFEMEVGLTPKRYCRLRRFQSAISKAHRMTQIEWTQLALDCGYFDQAHFIHEFREFAGVTPGEYASGSTPFQNHVTFLQSNENSFA
jgi:AraC-like DNA-binding protein